MFLTKSVHGTVRNAFSLVAKEAHLPTHFILVTVAGSLRDDPILCAEFYWSLDLALPLELHARAERLTHVFDLSTSDMSIQLVCSLGFLDFVGLGRYIVGFRRFFLINVHI